MQTLKINTVLFGKLLCNEISWVFYAKFEMLLSKFILY